VNWDRACAAVMGYIGVVWLAVCSLGLFALALGHILSSALALVVVFALSIERGRPSERLVIHVVEIHFWKKFMR
jgi:hypothetical protein